MRKPDGRGPLQSPSAAWLLGLPPDVWQSLRYAAAPDSDATPDKVARTPHFRIGPQFAKSPRGYFLQVPL